MSALLLPDRAELDRFVAALFRHCDPDTFLVLKSYFHDGKEEPVFQARGVRLDDPARGDEVERWAGVTAVAGRPAVFCPPVCTFRDARTARGYWAATKHDVANGMALSADADTAPQRTRAALVALLGPPTLAVASGGVWADPITGELQDKIHLHWRLTTPTRTPNEHKRLERARRLAAELTGADRTNAPLSHPLRWAGAVHNKGEPRHALVVAETDRELDLDDALAALEAAWGDRPVPEGDTRGGEPEAAWDDVAAALAVIPNTERTDWHVWKEIAMATFRATAGGGFGLFETWSAKRVDKHDPASCEVAWEQVERSPPDRIGFGSLVHRARLAVPEWVQPSRRVDAGQWFEEPSLFEDRGNGSQHVQRMRIIRPTEYQGVAIPPRRWLVRDWMPWGHVTGLYGEGGLGKSLLGQQLQTATALGQSWLGLETAQVRSLGFYCEDSEEELWRRQAELNRQYGCAFRDLEAARWTSRLGDDNILIRFNARTGTAELTRRHAEIIEEARDHRAELVNIDTVSDTFGGNENDRGQVRAYVSYCLGGIARAIGGSVLCLAHPSRAGIASGSGDGGSTGWSAAFRSRLSLQMPVIEKGDLPDPDARVLSRRKANYAARDDAVKLRWHAGALVLDAPAEADRQQARPCAEVFLALLDEANRLNRNVAESSRAANYAPKLFAMHPDCNGWKPADFQRAMERLFAAGAIRVEAYGRKGDQRQRVVRTAAEPAEVAT